MVDRRRIREWVGQEEKKLVALAQEFVQTPSLCGEEHRLARRVLEELQRIGVDEAWVDGIGNVVARIRGEERRPTLLLNGHLDHVGPGLRGQWKADPFAGIALDGEPLGASGRVVYGRGASDMKGWMAAALTAARALRELHITPRRDILFSFVVQEELGQAAGTRYLFEVDKIEADFAIVGEASGLDVMVGHRGTVDVRIVLRGRIGHASLPRYGVNAVSAMARLIPVLEEMPMPSDALFGPGTVCVRRINCSEGVLATIPDVCTISVLRKIVPGETCEGVLREFEQVVERVTSQAAGDVYLNKYFPPLSVDPADQRVKPQLALLGEIVNDVTGRPPQLRTWQFGTDGFYLHEVLGIPTLGFGPGDERYSHTPLDHVPVKDLIEAAATYAAFAATFS